MSFDQAIVGRDSRAVEPGSRGSIRLQVPQHVDLQPLFEHQVGQRQVENVVIQRRDRGSGDEPIAAHEGLRRSAMFVAGARAGRGVGHAVRVFGEDAIPGGVGPFDIANVQPKDRLGRIDGFGNHDGASAFR